MQLSEVTLILSGDPVARSYRRIVNDHPELQVIKASKMQEGGYDISRSYVLLSAFVFKVFLVKNLFKSKTFLYRLVRGTSLFDFLFELSRKKISLTLLLITILKVAFLAPILVIALVPSGLLKKLAQLRVPKELEAAVVNSRKRVWFPFMGFDTEQLYLPYLCRKYNRELVYAVDNWDNLSSKTVMIDYPDRIFVWGFQSYDHAVRIQGCNPDIVSIAPSPRLSIYRTFKRSSNFVKKVGFAGAFMSFDEYEALLLVLNSLPDDWEIVYRPHPWAMREPSLREIEATNRISVQKLGGLDEFFDSVDFVVGGLTTVLLESTLVDVPYIALAYSDSPLNFYSPKMALSQYEHFRDIGKLPSVKLVNSKVEIDDAVKSLINSPSKSPPDNGWIDYHVDIKSVVNAHKMQEDL